MGSGGVFFSVSIHPSYKFSLYQLMWRMGRFLVINLFVVEICIAPYTKYAVHLCCSYTRSVGQLDDDVMCVCIQLGKMKEKKVTYLVIPHVILRSAPLMLQFRLGGVGRNSFSHYYICVMSRIVKGFD